MHSLRGELGLISWKALTCVEVARNTEHTVNWEEIYSIRNISLCNAMSIGELNGRPVVLIEDNSWNLWIYAPDNAVGYYTINRKDRLTDLGKYILWDSKVLIGCDGKPTRRQVTHK